MDMQMPVTQTLADHGYAYGMPGVAYDGNDFF